MTRIWTLEEANEELPDASKRLRECQVALAALREANEQVTDIERLHGGPPSVKHDDHEDWIQWNRDRDSAAGELSKQLRGFEVAGITVKDVESGLIDFLSVLGDHQVWLCWRLGEPEVSYYHNLDGGFSARRPIPHLSSADP